MGLDDVIDKVKDKVEEVVEDVVENVNEVRENVADKIEETGEKISDAISENAKDKYDAYKNEYAQWESQMQNQSTEDIEKSAQENGYNLQYDTNGNIDWESTRAENYPPDNLKEDRDNAEKSAFNIENMSKNFAEWLRGGPNQTASSELVEIKDGIADTVSKLDHIIKDFDSKILSEINQFYTDLGANTGKWEGETQVKAIAIAELFKIYLDDIKYFYEALKTHIQMLEQDTESFYGNSSQVRNLNSLIR
ncbi:hypothetical protein [Anaerosacchariphilus polymeriproducens]|uniref:Uncharacterized protein n=1 Tax=Anaerosacchariphilus polymeriproducens TaxID=1812858 RepID=A0A371AXG9_9FIRM|nr:hypothetical protein [Anaerosacchariphilus polymeriproducens]RDU24241.1 hypothetical protein DWV06_05960 [Anaerosacchariphilus polymeriproducens]